MLRIEISEIFLIIKTLELKTNGSFIHMNKEKKNNSGFNKRIINKEEFADL